MTYFGINEIFISVISALIYGCVFAFFKQTVSLVRTEINSMLFALSSSFKYVGGIFSNPFKLKEMKEKGEKNASEEREEKNRKPTGEKNIKGNCPNAEENKSKKFRSELSALLYTVTFFIGVILLSYYSLDGAVRIYFVLLSAVSFLLFEKLLKKSVFSILDRLLRAIIIQVVYLIRIISYPFVRIFLYFLKKIHKNRQT